MGRYIANAVQIVSGFLCLVLLPGTVDAAPNTQVIVPPAKAIATTPKVKPPTRPPAGRPSYQYSTPVTSFPDRKAIIVNNCPLVELSNFKFENRRHKYSRRHVTDLSWKNTSEKSIIAFEIVLLEFDPFNRRTGGGRVIVTGRNSADWRPLGPGQQGSDGFIDYREREILTSIVYVRAVRLSDGSVWFADVNDVNAQIKHALPELTELSDVDPGPRKNRPEDMPSKEGHQHP